MFILQIEAIVQHGNWELRSNKASKDITTYAPPNSKPGMLLLMTVRDTKLIDGVGLPYKAACFCNLLSSVFVTYNVCMYMYIVFLACLFFFLRKSRAIVMNRLL